MKDCVKKMLKEFDDFEWVKDTLNIDFVPAVSKDMLNVGDSVLISGYDEDNIDVIFDKSVGVIIGITPFRGNDVILVKFNDKNFEENVINMSSPLWDNYKGDCGGKRCWSFMRDYTEFEESKDTLKISVSTKINESVVDNQEWFDDIIGDDEPDKEYITPTYGILKKGLEVIIDGSDELSNFDWDEGIIIDEGLSNSGLELILVKFYGRDDLGSNYFGQVNYRNHNNKDCDGNCWSFLKDISKYDKNEGEDVIIFVKNPLYRKPTMTENVIRKKLNMDLPKSVLQMNQIFKNNGYELYVVGGAVRDLLLGQEPKDFDLVTNAKPEEIKSMLNMYQTINVGEQFGIVNVVAEDGQYEIATFRKDLGRGRRPDSVEFTSIDQDVLRRDLTINALFYDIDKGEVVDLVGGIDDIERNLVRTVGSASERFDEDKLRILRSIRFASRTGSKLDKDIVNAITKDKTPISGNGLPLSQERIRDEFLKGIKQSQSVGYFTQMITNLNLWDWIFGRLVVKTDPLIETRNPIVLIATLLISNEPKLVENYIIDTLKYTSEEGKKIAFLIKFFNTNSGDLYKLKERYDAIRMDDDTLRIFGQINNINPKLIEAFIKYKITTSGEEIMKQGFKGREIGIEKDRIERGMFKKLMKEEVKKVSYSAVVLTEQSRTKLINSLNIPEGWDIIAHHMTINMGPIKEIYKPLLGQSIDLLVTHVGELDNVMAVKVDTQLVIDNKTPHITIAVDKQNGGKPVISNNITEWESMSPLELEGVIKEIYF
jgi:tRNA nucleotidyltransferase/poly(A) polymerase